MVVGIAVTCNVQGIVQDRNVARVILQGELKIVGRVRIPDAYTGNDSSTNLLFLAAVTYGSFFPIFLFKKDGMVFFKFVGVRKG